ncbi:MAG: MFS transporter [Chloroflexi bacterium]|nr:MFS transporter [Chloroflexota bacterium]
MAMFISLLGLGIVVPLLPIYAEDLGASGIAIGLMIAGFSISRGVLQPFMGGLSDRHGRKRFMIAGLFVYSLVGLAFPLATTVEHLVIIRIAHGVGSAMITPIAMSYVGDLTPPNQEGRYMGMFNIAIFSGIGFGPIIGGVFRDSLGFDSAFYAMTVLSAMSLALLLVVLPSDHETENRRTAPPILTTMRRMSHNVRLMGVLLSRMSTMVIVVPTFAFLPILMTRFMDSSGTEIGVVIAARTLTNAALQVPAGRIVDSANKVNTLVMGSLVVVASTFVIPFADTFVQLILIFVVMGAGEAFVAPTLGAFAMIEGRVYGQGAMMGVFNMSMSGGILVGSLGAGVLVDSFGVEYAFPAVALVLLVSTVISAAMIRAGSEPDPDAVPTPSADGVVAVSRRTDE